MPTKTIHIPIPSGHPNFPHGLFAEVPLWCGKVRSAKTESTVFAARATCKRCLQADSFYREDLDYRRTRERLAKLAALESGKIVSHSPGFGANGTLCKGYREGDDIDSGNVTCPDCKARIQAANERLMEAQA